MRPIISVSMLMALAACQTAPRSDSAPTQADEAGAARAIRQWADAFNSCDAVAASALYSPQAVLWGTVSSAMINTAAGVRQYFERVCSSTPKPRVALQEQNVRVFGDTALNSGTYTFTVFPAGQERRLPARFSFAYRWEGGQWRIVDHHSSALPAPPAAPPSAPAPSTAPSPTQSR